MLEIILVAMVGLSLATIDTLLLIYILGERRRSVQPQETVHEEIVEPETDEQEQQEYAQEIMDVIHELFEGDEYEE